MKKVIACFLLLLMSKTYAMQDWQKTPGQRLGGEEQSWQSAKRVHSPSLLPMATPASSAPAVSRDLSAMVAGHISMISRAEVPTTVSSIPPAGFVSHGPRQSGGALPPQETDSKCTISMTISSAPEPETTFARAPLAPGSIDIQSHISERPHIINPEAKKYSRTIQTMLDVSEIIEGVITIPDLYTDDQLYLITEILNFLAQHMEEVKTLPGQQVMIDFIRNRTHNFERISFVDALAIINFMDVFLAFDAIIAMHQPLSLPKNRAEAIRYNQQLFSIAQLTRGTRDQRLWQLFGSMLYPGCLQYPECAEIIKAIPTEFESVVLGAYMQHNIQLYQHVIRTIEDISLELHLSTIAIAVQREKDLILINSVTGAIINTFDDARFKQFSPDGQIMAVSHKGGNLILINSATGTIIQTIKGVWFEAFSPDGQIIAVQRGHNIILINSVTGAIINTINDIWVKEFSPDGQTIAARQGDDNFMLINSSTGAILQTINNGREPRFSPDGQTMVVKQAENLIIINSATGAIIQTINNVREGRESLDGQRIVGRQGDNIILINSLTGAILQTINNGREPRFSPDGQTMVVNQAENLIIINSVTGAIVHTINDARVNFILKNDDEIFSPDGHIIAGQQGKNFILINSETGAIIHTINNVYFNRFSPDGQRIVGYQGNNIILINSVTGAIIYTINNVYFERFSPDGQRIVGYQGDNFILINSATGAIIHTINNACFSQFSPDGQMIVARQGDKFMLINSSTGAIIRFCNYSDHSYIYFTHGANFIVTYFIPPKISEKILLQLKGYMSLGEALLSPIINSGIVDSVADGSCGISSSYA